MCRTSFFSPPSQQARPYAQARPKSPDTTTPISRITGQLWRVFFRFSAARGKLRSLSHGRGARGEARLELSSAIGSCRPSSSEPRSLGVTPAPCGAGVPPASSRHDDSGNDVLAPFADAAGEPAIRASLRRGESEGRAPVPKPAPNLQTVIGATATGRAPSGSRAKLRPPRWRSASPLPHRASARRFALERLLRYRGQIADRRP
jgi:hypothetical protein